jgi:hypothetical protein
MGRKKEPVRGACFNGPLDKWISRPWQRVWHSRYRTPQAMELYMRWRRRREMACADCGHELLCTPRKGGTGRECMVCNTRFCIGCFPEAPHSPLAVRNLVRPAGGPEGIEGLLEARVLDGVEAPPCIDEEPGERLVALLTRKTVASGCRGTSCAPNVRARTGVDVRARMGHGRACTCSDLAVLGVLERSGYRQLLHVRPLACRRDLGGVRRLILVSS